MGHFLRTIKDIVSSTTLLVMFFLCFSTGIFAQTTYTTAQSGSWIEPSTWVGNFPSYNGGLSNNTKIHIHHNVRLIGESFLTGKSTNTLEIHVGDSVNAVTLTIDKNFTISKTIKLYIHKNSTLQIGVQPEDPLFDFCDENYDGDYQRSLFKVEGSNHPTLSIGVNGTFLLYGDFVVENKFDITVGDGGEFIVKGNFDAGNSAEVTFSGAGGEIGCDMTFDNGASITLNVGSLWIGGDLNFGNSGDVYLSGSSITVSGGICSTQGQGSGATINLHGDSNNSSTISAGSICSTTFGEDYTDYPGIEFGDDTLPIELLSFTAAVKSENVVLSWITATEISNDFFTIERSNDLNHWEVVGMVQGAGTSSTSREYSLTDAMPIIGISYYRLKQTDFDGAFEYFAPVAVNFSGHDTDLNFGVIKNGNEWTVALPGDNTYQVEVYTLSGYKLHAARAAYNLTIPDPKQAVVIRVYNESMQRASRVVM